MDLDQSNNSGSSSAQNSSMITLIKQENEKFSEVVSVTYNNPQFCDYKIVIGKTVIYIVSALVAAHSPVFAKMFSIGMVEQSTKTVVIEDEDEAPSLNIIFRYMHSGRLDCDLQQFVPCVLLAHKYEVQSLVQLCGNHIDKILAKDNCFHVFLSLQSVQSDLFKDAYDRCINMCAARLQTCPLDIFVNLNVPTLKKLVSRASQNKATFNNSFIMRMLFEWVAHDYQERYQYIPQVHKIVEEMFGKYEPRASMDTELFSSLGGSSGNKVNYEISLSSSGGASDHSQLANPQNVSNSIENSYGTRGPHWIQIKLLKNVFSVDRYTIHQENDKLMRNWQLEGSVNGNTWVTLRKHDNDTSITPQKLSNTWDVQSTNFFSHLRINCDGDFSIYRLEFFGELA